MTGDGSATGGEIVRELVICNSRGLHARASAKFVKCAERFDARVHVVRDGQRVEATSIMGLMMLAASPGCAIRIEAEGREAEQAVDAISELVASGFGEDRTASS